MHTYVVQCNETCSPDDVQDMMDDVEDQGGNITRDFIAIKAFWAESDEDLSLFLESHEHAKLIEERDS